MLTSVSKYRKWICMNLKVNCTLLCVYLNHLLSQKGKPHYSACDNDFLSKSQKYTLLCVCLAYKLYFWEKHTTLRVTEKRQWVSRIKHYSACLPKYLLSQALSRLYLSHLYLLKLSKILCIDFNSFLNIHLKR